MHRLGVTVVAIVSVSAVLAIPRSAAAYSVLAHEALVDAAWADSIAPMLRQRYPAASDEQIIKARAYAYGGSVIQDLGYYPFGSHFFTDLLHYVRSGDFIEALIRNARTVDEYAFALGALAHYAGDITGHSLAVNRSVPLIYPKLRAKFGDVVTYDEDPKRHIMVEFAFDVVHVVGNGYVPATFTDFIGFEVSKPLLERAFRDTYGLELSDVFADVDLASAPIASASASSFPTSHDLRGARSRMKSASSGRALTNARSCTPSTGKTTSVSSALATGNRAFSRDSSCSS